MTTDQNDQLLTLKLKLKSKQKAERILKDLQKILRNEKQKLNDLFVIMQKEEQDVKDLEKTSLTSLYYSVMGNKKQQLNKEQVEFFAAKLKFDSCQNSITSLKGEIQGYQKTIDQCDEYEN